MRRHRWSGLGAVALLAGLIVGPATAAHAADWQKVVNVANGECMEVRHQGGNYNGQLVRQWNCVGGDTQLWVFVQSFDTQWKNLINAWSGKCLQPVGTRIGDHLEVTDCTNSVAQQWDIFRYSSTDQGRMLLNLESRLCVRVPTTDRQVGLFLEQVPCFDENMLTWYI